MDAEGESAATTPDVAEYDDDRGVLLRGGYLAEPPAGARAWPEGSDVALQGRLLNEAATDDAILSASSPVAASVVLLDADGQVVEALPLPAGQPVDLSPAGPTVLLRGITGPLTEGASVRLDLVTRESGTLPTSVQVLIEDPAVALR
ncbi:copper chaperone PCu(A)C [Vallicoccus soli]|uniref:copper chaperone PCu(A)C n=1 Tax=Vallicoccus soli TaxID=2339232 RepID=UPI001403EDD1|nr:copper chaperone PCu(A)C [Vallicoccus soli]